MSSNIPISQAQAGDIFLYDGKGLLSELIELFDGTPVSHSSLYLGNSQVGEAVAEGVVSRDIATSRKDCSSILIRRLNSNPPTMQPVLTRAQYYLSQGDRYAYEQLLLLAVLSLTRKVKITPILDVLVRKILDEAAALLEKMVAGTSGREAMICSEFVHRSYEEALPELDDVYSLHINDFPVTGNIMGISAMPPVSRRIHPQSLAALLTSPSSRHWLVASPPTVMTSARQKASKGEPQLNALIKTYLSEVSSGKVATKQLSSTSLAAINVSAHAFVTSFARQRQRSLGRIGIGITSLQAEVSTDPWGTISDFVTPGDLYRATSLHSVGELS